MKDIISTIPAKIRHAVTVFVKNPGAVKALATWPKFSIASYSVISPLSKQGILPRTVVDVGSNVGQFAVACVKLFPEATVHSFEPVPECVVELRRNVSGLNVTVYPFALGEEEGDLRFYVNSFSPSSSPLPLAEQHRQAFPHAQEERTIEVEVSTLDQVFDGVNLERPVMVKLDVQGYEAKVLRGGEETLKRADYVIMEVSFKPMYEGEAPFMEMARTMEGYGLRFERPVGWLTDPETGEILQMDALFVQAI